MALQTFRIIEASALDGFTSFPTRDEVDKEVGKLSAGNYVVVEEIYRAERKEELTTTTTQQRRRPRNPAEAVKPAEGTKDKGKGKAKA